MPKPKTKKSVADTTGTSAKGDTVELPKELIDQLLAAAGGGAGLTGPDGLLKKLTAALVNRALDAEMSEHLGYDSGERPPSRSCSSLRSRWSPRGGTCTLKVAPMLGAQTKNPAVTRGLEWS